MSSGVVLIAV